MTTVLVITYNSAPLMRACLSALTGTPTIVVDNASADETVAIVRREFPEVRVIARPDNGGYAVAVNEGSRAAPDDDILVINPDVIVRPGSLAALEAYVRGHPRVGLAVPRLVYPDGSIQESVRRFPDPLALLARRMPLLARTPPGRAILRRFLLGDDIPSQPRPIEWAIGAAHLVRRAALREVGGMQEWIFLYGEDLDWCYRMWQKGWEVHVVPESVMEHRFTRLSSRTLDLRSAATRHHWMSLVKLFILHPTLLVGRGPRAAREAVRAWERSSAA
jgi:GT2 family glycosyltransferase